jgi:phage terminase large subunit-like protein
MTIDTEKFPLSAKAILYAEQVLSGDVLACKWVRLACERFLRDLERAETDAFPYRWDTDKAEKVMRFAQKLPHVKGKWARKDPKTGKPQRLKLEPWQCFCLGNIFGWVKKTTGFRRFNRASIYIPRKAGKSFLSCVIGWWMFAKDDEPGAEVYCGATTEGQAWEVFRPARQMGLVEPALPEGLGVEIFGNSMKKTDDGSRFEPVIGKPGDGASPHCAIVDEYHEHPDSVLYDTMKTGMGAREQALLLIISTAGDNLSGPCREDWRNCEKMLENAFEDETKFACIWTIDEGDDWANETAIAKANPNWGVSVNPDMVLPDLEEAKRDPAKQAVFKTKQLNLWVNAKNGWLNMEKWNACADASLRMEDFAGQPCWVGIDAAAKIDVFSVVAVFERDDHLVVFPRHFMPEETIALPHNKHMQKWVAQGFLTATPGARTDQMQVENILREWSGKYYIQEVAYDPKEISYLMNQVRTWAGFPCIEMTQGPTLISEPMKELEAKINTLKLRHTACPMLTWMASNVIKKEARGGGPVKYYYPAKEKDDRKIDGVVALIMALSRQMAQQGGAGVGFY